MVTSGLGVWTAAIYFHVDLGPERMALIANFLTGQEGMLVVMHQFAAQQTTRLVHFSIEIQMPEQLPLFSNGPENFREEDEDFNDDSESETETSEESDSEEIMIINENRI